MAITHSTVVVTADDGTSEVGTDEWNAAHTVATDLEITGSGTVAISGGTLVLGDDAAIAFNPSGFNITGRLQTHGTSQNTTANVFARWSADASSSGINFAKSRHATAGSHTTLDANDTMGYIRWLGSDGTEHRNSAAIQAVVDDATGANDVPSRLEFYTRATGAANSARNVVIDRNGNVIIQSGVATPAGGSTSMRLVFGSTVGFGIYIGSGAPSVSAAQGSLYLRSDGSGTTNRAYINTDGGTTWTAITTAG